MNTIGIMRRQQQERRPRPQRGRVGKLRQPLAHGAVADLVVVLQAEHERRVRQMAARLARAPDRVRRFLPLVREAFGECRASMSSAGP